MAYTFNPLVRPGAPPLSEDVSSTNLHRAKDTKAINEGSCLKQRYEDYKLIGALHHSKKVRFQWTSNNIIKSSAMTYRLFEAFPCSSFPQCIKTFWSITDTEWPAGSLMLSAEWQFWVVKVHFKENGSSKQTQTILSFSFFFLLII